MLAGRDFFAILPALLLLGLSCLEAVSALPILYVTQSGSGDLSGRDAQNALNSLQHAIDSVDAHGQIVAAGPFSGEAHTNLQFNGKALLLKGVNNASITCAGVCRFFSFVAGESPSTVVDGFVLYSASTLDHGGAVKVGCYCTSCSHPCLWRRWGR